MDLSDCVNDVQINSLLYEVLDQDEIHATVWKSFIRVDVPLVSDHHARSVSARRSFAVGTVQLSWSLRACLGKSFSKSESTSCVQT